MTGLISPPYADITTALLNTGLVFCAESPLKQATLLFLKPDSESAGIRVGGQSVPCRPQSLYGFDFETVTVDISGQLNVEVL